MPSPESAALADLFRAQTAHAAANPNMDITSRRYMLEALHTAAAEPTDVTYATVKTDGIRGMWAKPVSIKHKDAAILYCHGGGFLTGSPDSHRKLAGHLAARSGMAVFSLDYRLAPEHPFPAAVEDSAAAFKWLVGQGFAAHHIGTAGDSAGGNLAVTTALKLRDDGAALPGAIVGFSPWFDLESSGATMKSNADKDVLVNGEVTQLMSMGYLQGQSAQAPLANPLYAELKGLPSVFMTVGTYEALQDNPLRFAERAKAAGVEVEVEEVEGMQHVHVAMVGNAPEADTSMEKAARFLEAKLVG